MPKMHLAVLLAPLVLGQPSCGAWTIPLAPWGTRPAKWEIVDQMHSPLQTCKLVRSMPVRTGARMTESEELTIQRYQAICRGHDKSIPRFEAMMERLLYTLPNRHHRTMASVMQGKKPSAAALQEACAAIAEQLEKHERGEPIPEELTIIPAAMRRGPW